MPNKRSEKESSRLLTKRELHETARERTHLIAAEFKSAFNFLEKYPKSVTIFGGTRFPETHPYYQKAHSLALSIVKKLHYAVLTGGGPGIMEAANRGAFEAGGDSLGLEIELDPIQESNPYITDNIYFHYFFSRKMALSFSAEAYIFFPGGFGSMDEFFEILTLVQTGKIEKVPVILFCSEYWSKLDELIKDEFLTRGTVTEEEIALYKITDDEDEVIELIKNAPIHNGIRFSHKDLEKSGIISRKSIFRI
ncbi:MAG TPA: TIGR00730 family Rossman fold protein [Candidatus Paceibacterota bacterium]